MSGGAAFRRLRLLHIATFATWALICAHSASTGTTPKRCPRPDIDCFNAAFTSTASSPLHAATDATAADRKFLPLSSNAASDAVLSGGVATPTPTPTTTTAWSWKSYHSHPEMLDFLSELVSSSDGACSLEWPSPSSVEGRRIVAVVWSAVNGSSDSPSGLPKPSFTWVGNMHGDETANRELLLRLAWGLCSGELAAADGRWRELQASTLVRIVPTMNPDGTDPPPPNLAMAATLQGAPRFPAAVSWTLVGGSLNMQPEANAISSYLSYAVPDLSANLHGGALVANYPLDACDSLGARRSCPTGDEPLPELLASAYAAAHPSMALGNATPFVSGTVQGAAWYPVLGSLQDWVYHVLGRLHITLELHPVKNPPAASLPPLWEANRRAMLRLMELARMGLRARVVDAVTRGPLAANVSVASPAGVRGTTADAERGGYFFKPMAPGVKYEFVVQPYDPSNPNLSYDEISFSVALSVRREVVISGAYRMRELTVERVLMAFRSNATASVRK
ncbi:hypothetical protein VOLCADRAFT_90763 [Volvox carteri f. nagariensis]|uniref:Peptidase M14 domain-containing protein n=1 Tax=Volvox carteri f. nagariensis TaxID=3068 RepID=D8TVN9_VOLCA|nr:uncharacterized protein VOLCADRAFT_90763 [Volvox carteri f. nagariensis]EFJ48616.1 hypothetical protein VOLCADRAFT_90763 [Volvox carteri f. nagariensis]|eukprot:XP_002950415.1 hypothetical protein VOLCADRAFT_90763 [Volvox carteri f. nagariensis]